MIVLTKVEFFFNWVMNILAIGIANHSDTYSSLNYITSHEFE